MNKYMVRLLIISLLASSAFAAPGSKSPRFFHWVDKDGNMYYGDRVPAEYASNGHNVLNSNGVIIESVDGEKSDAQIAEENRIAAEEQLVREEREAEKRRDKNLLLTFLSVEEIEALRDQRSVLLSSKVRITEVYLDELRDKLGQLEKDAQKYEPYSTDPSARALDSKLASELADTLDSIMLYEENLCRIRDERDVLLDKFDLDIGRFEELTSHLN